MSAARRREPSTLALLLAAWSDVLLEWGSRWAFQIAFWAGFGAGVGALTAWWTLWLSRRMSCG